MKRTLAQAFSDTFQAYQNCVRTDNREWKERHSARLGRLEKKLPSGSGIDRGVKLDFERSAPQKLVFSTYYHHMNEHGSYDGWTDHVVTVTPVFGGLEVRISGRDRNEIKEYLNDTFYHALMKEVDDEPVQDSQSRITPSFEGVVATERIVYLEDIE